MSTILPDKASELLRLAVNDLEAVEQKEGYAINMSTWHTNINNMLCFVCFAGSVMANSFNTNPCITHHPADFPLDECDKFIALDQFRAGGISEALLTLGFDGSNFHNSERSNNTFEDFPGVYIADAGVFKQQMLDLADILEVEGY